MVTEPQIYRSATRSMTTPRLVRECEIAKETGMKKGHRDALLDEVAERLSRLHERSQQIMEAVNKFEKDPRRQKGDRVALERAVTQLLADITAAYS